jgi:hypothetical protein
MKQPESKLNKFSVILRIIPRGLALILISLLFPLLANAAVLYLEPSTAEYRVGDSFILESRIDLEPDENINVVEINLEYPSDLLEGVDVSFGNSILNLILQKPTINQEQGIISFAGGIIGGYTGKIPGDPDLSNLLARIIFRVVPHQALPEPAQVFFGENSQVLLNDGFGTPTKLTLKPAIIKISEAGNIKVDQWQKEIIEDKIPPESFTPEITQIEGKYYLVFSTVDKQTGLDYYQIAEQAGKETQNYAELKWTKAESPYLLKDQKLKSYIYLKAVDKAKNERIVVIPPRVKTAKIWLKILLPLIIAFIIVIVCFRLKRHKK